jgi:hypothetical protein
VARILGWAILELAACGHIGFDEVSGAPGDDPSGLIVRFSFEGPVDAPIVDSISGHPGVCVPPGCPTPVPGHARQGYRFDGVDDCIDIIDYGHLEPPQLTIALWSNQDQTAIQMTHFAKPALASACDSWEIEPSLDGTSSIAFTTDHASNCLQYVQSAPSSIAIGRWTHVAASWDGATKRLYLDGIEVGSMAMPDPIVYDTSHAYIGCDNDGSPLKYFAGVLDEVELYDRALSPAEISSLAAR